MLNGTRNGIANVLVQVHNLADGPVLLPFGEGGANGTGTVNGIANVEVPITLYFSVMELLDYLNGNAMKF